MFVFCIKGLMNYIESNFINKSLLSLKKVNDKSFSVLIKYTGTENI